MTVPSLHLSSEPFLEIEGDVVVIGVRKTDTGPLLLTDNPVLLSLGASLTSIGVTGSLDELTRLPAVTVGGPSIALIGLGSGGAGTGKDANANANDSAAVSGTAQDTSGSFSANDLRYASGSAARQLRGI
jgi:leucyl aminopeptidase